MKIIRALVSFKFYHVQNDFIISSNFIAQIVDYFFFPFTIFLSLYSIFLNIHDNVIFQTKYKIFPFPSFSVIWNTYVIYNDGCYSKCMLIIRSIYRRTFLFVLHEWLGQRHYSLLSHVHGKEQIRRTLIFSCLYRSILWKSNVFAVISTSFTRPYRYFISYYLYFIILHFFSIKNHFHR